MGKSAGRGFVDELRGNWQLYVLALPLAIWLILYAYKPLVGLVIAFQKFSPFKGIEGSPFVGLDNFQRLMAGPSAYMFWRALKNTVLISLYGLVFGFPIPIILAILFNEAREGLFRKSVQTVSYLPYLLSEVTIASIVLSVLQLNGLVNVGAESLLGALGLDYKRVAWMSEPAFFQGIYTLTGIWKSAGFDSIVFFAALVGISPTLYEAARIDGAS
jgi:putative aldouronate transport system permease protein